MAPELPLEKDTLKIQEWLEKTLKKLKKRLELSSPGEEAPILILPPMSP